MKYGYLMCIILMATSSLISCQNSKLNGLEFDEFDNATKVEIHSFPSSTESPTLIRTLDTVKQVKFAKEFIQNHPNGWDQPKLSPMPAYSFSMQFFEGDNRLGWYVVGPDFLGYGLYWRPLSEQDRVFLIETLEIPIK